MLIASAAGDGRSIGMSHAQNVNLDDLSEEISSEKFKLPVHIRTHREELSSGKLMLVVAVQEGESVETSLREIYIRVTA